MQPKRMTWAVAVAGAVMLGGGAARAADTCTTAKNGTCDELKTCLLDTDTTDCRAACGADATAEIAGACSHYAALDLVSAPPPPDTGSHGTGGPIGFWPGTIVAPWTRATTEIERHYMVYVPATYDPRKPTPLVLALSGNYMDMYGVPPYMEWLRMADLNGFIVAFAQQQYINSGAGFIYSWVIYQNNWEGGDWAQNPEVKFVAKLIGEMKGKYNIDRTRIISSGHSRGAALSFTVAFEMPNLVAGIISEMGFVTPQKYDARMKTVWKGPRKIPTVLVHGRPDPDVSFVASEAIASTLTGMGWVEDTDFVFHRFDNIGHEWQPQLNQENYDFIADHPLPIEMAAP